jgi:precorrin-2/cobalt-factor-2 C20-methyltransferase
MNSKTGKFYGIGVGPGDPELITLKASRILRSVDVVFAAASTKNDHSLAVRIAGQYIPGHTDVRKLRFPMTTDEKETGRAWRENAARIYDRLKQGLDVAFLTLGDPMTYSTFGYISRYIKQIDPAIVIETVPGITSYQAAAARLNMPLVEGEESLVVVSGAKGGNCLRQMSAKPENIVFLKAYRHISDIAGAILETNREYRCVGISKCGLPEERIIQDI